MTCSPHPQYLEDFFFAADGEHRNPEWEVYLRPKHTLLRVQESVWHPPTDVFETDDSYYIRVELAGMNKEDINVLVNDGLLSVSGSREDRTPRDKIRYRQMEVKYGRFEVNLRLPDDVDLGQVEAVYEGGFLETRLPKRRDSQISELKVVIQIG